MCLSSDRSTSLCYCVSTCFPTLEREEPGHCVVHSERESKMKKNHYWRNVIEFDRMELQYEYTMEELLRGDVQFKIHVDI